MDKWCIRCQTVKSIAEFAVDRTRRDGHKTWCKACAAAYNRQYRLDKIVPFKPARVEHVEVTAEDLAENRVKIARQMGLDRAPTGCEGCRARKACYSGMLRGGTTVPALCELSDEAAGVPEEQLVEDRNSGEYPWWIDRKD